MHEIILQFAADNTPVPSAALLRKWASAALDNKVDAVEVTLRIVNLEEMTQLNSAYRHKNGPTNVLSFPLP